MEQKCPGRTNVRVEADLLTCTHCGATLEIFNDEIRVHCRCGQWLYRQEVPACAQWCSEAARCFGAAGSFKKLLDEACSVADKDEQERRLKELQERVAAAQAHCPLPDAKSRREPA